MPRRRCAPLDHRQAKRVPCTARCARNPRSSWWTTSRICSNSSSSRCREWGSTPFARAPSPLRSGCSTRSRSTSASRTCACPTARAFASSSTSTARVSTYPIAVITAYGSAANAVAALKAGAFDYLSKPVALEQLRALVKQALKVPEMPQSQSSYQLLGESPAMLQIRALIERLSKTQAPVFVTGDSGSGKELAARMIHSGGLRAGQPFIAVNCGAIPENLMESEFFGYKKGAFTGADDDREGFFQAANGGTLFLDEVADLPLAMQVKLLRVIQEKRVRKVGATQEEAVDVRIISATHQNLGAAGRIRRLPAGPLLPAARDRIVDAVAARDARGHPAVRHQHPRQVLARDAGANSMARRWRRSRNIRSREMCANSRTSSSAACRSPRIRCRSRSRTCTSRPCPRKPMSPCRRGKMAAAGLPRPRRAARHQRSPREDPLQPHRRRQVARHHLSRDALPDGAAGHKIKHL